MVSILAADPGHNFTGVAWLCDSGFFEATQFRNPLDAYRWMHDRILHRWHPFLVEDYTHGGTFTKEAKSTLEVKGFLVFSYKMDWGNDAKVVNKSRRLPWVTEAKEAIGEKYPDLPFPAVKDAVAALAHAMAERDRGQK